MTHLTLYVMKWKKLQNIEAHYHSFIDQNCLPTETEVKDTGVGHLLKKDSKRYICTPLQTCPNMSLWCSNAHLSENWLTDRGN